MRQLLAFASFFVAASVFGQIADVDETRHLTVSQWIRPAEPGMFVANVVLPQVDGGAIAVTNARVVLLGADGRVHRGTTDDRGEVYIHGVGPGVYAMLTRGDKAIACYAMHVLDHQHADQDSYPASIEIAAADLDYRSFEAITFPYLAPEYDRAILSLNDVQFGAITRDTRGNETFRVSQNENGISGRICAGSARGGDLIGAQSVNVMLVKDGVRIARVLSDTRGEFRFDNVGPGIYALIAVGGDGVGVVGFELRGSDSPGIDLNARTERRDGRRFVTQNISPPNQFEMQIIPVTPEEFNVIDDRVIDEEVVMDDPIISEFLPAEGFGVPISGSGFVPGAGGGVGGGGTGTGGGGGGTAGGGFGGIAALGALGAAVAIAASDDSAPRPVSPAVP